MALLGDLTTQPFKWGGGCGDDRFVYLGSNDGGGCATGGVLGPQCR